MRNSGLQSGKIEPNVCVTSKRLEAIRVLSQAGITCGVILMPALPFINDTEDNIERVVELSAQAGAKWVYADSNFAVSLRDRQRTYFYEKLDQLAEQKYVMPSGDDFSRMKDRYIRAFGNRYWCASPNRKALNNRFKEICRKHKLLYNHGEIDERIKSEFIYQQMSLF